MEFEELKSAWAQYDKKLSENLRLNEELLRSITFEKYNQALKKPLNLELLNIFIQLVMMGLVTAGSIRLLAEIQYLTVGIIGDLLCGTSLILSAVKANRFKKLLYYNLSIIHFQKELTRLRIYVFRMRKAEYMIAALMAVTIFPLFIKVTSHVDIFGHLPLLFPGILGVLALGFGFGILLNMKIYDKGINDAQAFLSMIEKFGKEE